MSGEKIAVPESAEQARQIKYEQNMLKVLKEIFDIFERENFLVHDANNVVENLKVNIGKKLSLLNFTAISENNREGRRIKKLGRDKSDAKEEEKEEEKI